MEIPEEMKIFESYPAIRFELSYIVISLQFENLSFVLFQFNAIISAPSVCQKGKCHPVLQ